MKKFHYSINSLFVPALSPLCPRFVPALSPLAIGRKPAWILGFVVCPRCPRRFCVFRAKDFQRRASKNRPAGVRRGGFGGCAGVGLSGAAPHERQHIGAGCQLVQVVSPGLQHGGALVNERCPVIGAAMGDLPLVG